MYYCILHLALSFHFISFLLIFCKILTHLILLQASSEYTRQSLELTASMMGMLQQGLDLLSIYGIPVCSSGHGLEPYINCFIYSDAQYNTWYTALAASDTLYSYTTFCTDKLLTVFTHCTHTLHSALINCSQYSHTILIHCILH